MFVHSFVSFRSFLRSFARSFICLLARSNDVSSNATRLVTGIAKHVSTYLKEDHLIEMHVGAILNNLTIDEKVYMVLDALRDCASADHWYTYEKDWG